VFSAERGPSSGTRFGLPLLALFVAVATLLVPVIWPF
jgi:hypothetical protein